MGVSKLMAAAAVSLAVAGGAPAWAATGQKDVQVAAKTFGFTDPALSGTVKVGLVYDAANPASQAEAEAVRGILGEGLKAGAATLVPVMVPVGQLDGALGDVRVVFVMGGMAAHYDRIFAATQARKLLSVSTDAGCVRAGRCVMGVASEPKVEIIVNKAAAEASSVAFSPAFRMMISEI